MIRSPRAAARHNDRFSAEGTVLRDPAAVVPFAEGLPHPTQDRLATVTRGPWWDILARVGGTLLLSREYEHLLMALTVDRHGPLASYLLLPHPSGIAVDPVAGAVHVAATRNPNQIFTLRAADHAGMRALLPSRAVFLPGRLYLHDLAMVGGHLHANAVGENAIIRVANDGAWERVWWPRCIEHDAGAHFERNYLQMNSIAAGASLESSFFSASTDRIGRRRPGHLNFDVVGRGVIFSGATRDPIVGGLTRPHSARLFGDQLWVDNSGYGEVGQVGPSGFTVVARLPGWTRGLCSTGGVIFAGTSRILPRFQRYAPGVGAAECGLHAIDAVTGEICASMIWPAGNQIFAAEWLPPGIDAPLPFSVLRRDAASRRSVFYSFGWSARLD